MYIMMYIIATSCQIVSGAIATPRRATIRQRALDTTVKYRRTACGFADVDYDADSGRDQRREVARSPPGRDPDDPRSVGRRSEPRRAPCQFLPVSRKVSATNGDERPRRRMNVDERTQSATIGQIEWTASGACGRKVVTVQILSSAPT